MTDGERIEAEARRLLAQAEADGAPAPDPDGFDDLSKYPPAGFHDLIGFRFVERTEGRMLGEMEIGPQHMNRAGVAHGGVYCTLIDAAASGAGLYCPYPGRVRRCLTISLTTTFLAPVREGLMTVEGRLLHAGRRSFTATADIRDAEGALLAHGLGSFRWFRGSETSLGDVAGAAA